MAKLMDIDALYASESDEFLFSKLYNETMEWGTYKPNQYFAVKDRSSSPLTVAMLWAVPIPGQGFQLRHSLRYQAGDGVTAYFEYHDGWGASRQIIEDPAANARFTIDFVKQVTQEEGSSKVESMWKALVNVVPINVQQQLNLYPFFYVSLEQNNLELLQSVKVGTTKQKILKVMR